MRFPSRRRERRWTGRGEKTFPTLGDTSHVGLIPSPGISLISSLGVYSASPTEPNSMRSSTLPSPVPQTVRPKAAIRSPPMNHVLIGLPDLVTRLKGHDIDRDVAKPAVPQYLGDPLVRNYVTVLEAAGSSYVQMVENLFVQLIQDCS